MRKVFDPVPELSVRINTEEMLRVVQFGAGTSLSRLEEHIRSNLDKGSYEAALGLKILLDMKNDVPLRTKYDSQEKAYKTVIPSSVHLKTYVDKAIEYFLREFNISMELQPIKRHDSKRSPGE